MQSKLKPTDKLILAEKINSRTVGGDVGGEIELYAVDTSDSPSLTAANLLAVDERFVHAGVMGLRAPDGSIVQNVPLYQIVKVDKATAKSALTDGEKAACEGIVGYMAEQFGKYVKAAKKLD